MRSYRFCARCVQWAVLEKKSRLLPAADLHVAQEAKELMESATDRSNRVAAAAQTCLIR
jgi:hypothetical protein